MADEHDDDVDEGWAIVQWLTSSEHRVSRDTALAMRNGTGYTWADVAACSGDVSLLRRHHADWPQGTLRALLVHAITVTSARRAASLSDGQEHVDALAPLLRLRACDVYLPCSRKDNDSLDRGVSGMYADQVMDDSLGSVATAGSGRCTLSQAVGSGAMRGKRAVCLRGANLHSISALAGALEDEVILVDLSLNRLTMHRGSDDCIRRLLQVETRHVMIAGNPLASADGADLFATLSLSELSRLHWVAENRIDGGNWKRALRGRDVQSMQRLQTAYNTFYLVLDELVTRGVWPSDE